MELDALLWEANLIPRPSPSFFFLVGEPRNEAAGLEARVMKFGRSA